MSYVEEINDIAELDGYRLLWNALLPQTRRATFFHSLDWLKTYWKHFGEGQRLRVLVVCSDGKPIGILPLVVRSEKSRVGRVRVLSYPLNDWGTFYGPIGPNPTATLTAGLRHIRRTARDYDLIDLRWVDRDGCDRGRTESAMRRVGFEPQRQPWGQTSVIDMAGTWDEYWSGRNAKWRRNVRCYERRLAELGEVRLLRYRPDGAIAGDDNPRWDLYDACTGIARRSWQGGSTNGTTLSHPSVADYLRDTHASAASAGTLDLNLLLLNRQPIAFVYHYAYEGRIYGLRKGFDPDFSAAGAGTVLQARVIEDSFQRGDTLYDMGVGSAESKRYWQTSVETSYRYTHFPIAVPRVQLLRVKRWLQNKWQDHRQPAKAQTA